MYYLDCTYYPSILGHIGCLDIFLQVCHKLFRYDSGIWQYSCHNTRYHILYKKCQSVQHARGQTWNSQTTVALFTKILTIKNCRKCKTKIKKSFTKILTIILSVKIVLTLRVKLPCPKCKILIVREILVLSLLLS